MEDHLLSSSLSAELSTYICCLYLTSQLALESRIGRLYSLPKIWHLHVWKREVTQCWGLAQQRQRPPPAWVASFAPELWRHLRTPRTRMSAAAALPLNRLCNMSCNLFAIPVPAYWTWVVFSRKNSFLPYLVRWLLSLAHLFIHCTNT